MLNAAEQEVLGSACDIFRRAYINAPKAPRGTALVLALDLHISFALTASFNIMAELAAAATIIQLIQFSGVILTSCYDYISKVKSASGDIEKVINDVSGLEGILKRLHALISDGEDERHALLKSLERPNGPF